MFSMYEFCGGNIGSQQITHSTKWAIQWGTEPLRLRA